MIAVGMNHDEYLVLKVNYKEAMEEIIDICKKYEVAYRSEICDPILAAGYHVLRDYEPHYRCYVYIKDVPIMKTMDFWKEINSKPFYICINKRKVA